jgi:hypothetical protein
MKTFAFFLNFFLPGLGTLFAKKIIEGILQLVIWVVTLLLIITGLLAVLGIPLGFINVMWATYSVATTFNKPETHRQFKINT